jgi:hypothetical protein
MAVWRWFGAFHDGRRHFPRTSSSPPIKGGHPLHSSTFGKIQHKRDLARREKSSIHILAL